MKLVKSSSSILRKFLVFNFFIFLFLGSLTFFYLSGIQPNLVKQRMEKHTVIINNTSNHLERLSIEFDKESLKNFLLSTRFLFQNLERVQFYDITGNLIADTNVLDLDQSVFTKTEIVMEEDIKDNNIKKLTDKDNLKNDLNKSSNINSLKEIIINKKNDEPTVLEVQEGDNLFIKTLGDANINGDVVGYILVTEQTNEILTAVEERKNFIIRTVLAIALVILIFSLFLNKYILKPIGFLVSFTEAIKNKSDQNIDIKNFFVREDEVGKLTKSIDEMTKELQKRTTRAETFSTDLAHEIRNP